MRRLLLSVVVTGVALVLQLTVLNELRLPGGGVPDLVLVVVASLGLAGGPVPGAMTGFTAGLCLDLAPPASGVVGQYALVLCLVGWTCGSFRDTAARSALVPIVIVAAAVVVGDTIVAFLGMSLQPAQVTWTSVRQILPSDLLYDAVISPFVLYALLLASAGLDAAWSGAPARRGALGLSAAVGVGGLGLGGRGLGGRGLGGRGLGGRGLGSRGLGGRRGLSGRSPAAGGLGGGSLGGRRRGSGGLSVPGYARTAGSAAGPTAGRARHGLASFAGTSGSGLLGLGGWLAGPPASRRARKAAVRSTPRLGSGRPGEGWVGSSAQARRALSGRIAGPGLAGSAFRAASHGGTAFRGASRGGRLTSGHGPRSRSPGSKSLSGRSLSGRSLSGRVTRSRVLGSSIQGSGTRFGGAGGGRVLAGRASAGPGRLRLRARRGNGALAGSRVSRLVAGHPPVRPGPSATPRFRARPLAGRRPLSGRRSRFGYRRPSLLSFPARGPGGRRGTLLSGISRGGPGAGLGRGGSRGTGLGRARRRRNGGPRAARISRWLRRRSGERR